VNTQPVKSELSVAAPKSQAKDPIQLDIILVCRKASAAPGPSTADAALVSAAAKLQRLQAAGFRLSRNDRRIVLYGQLLTTIRSPSHIGGISRRVDEQLARMGDSAPTERTGKLRQLEMF
jgi:hypothetical protein